jgi:hypothetical protein
VDANKTPIDYVSYIVIGCVFMAAMLLAAAPYFDISYEIVYKVFFDGRGVY